MVHRRLLTVEKNTRDPSFLHRYTLLRLGFPYTVHQTERV